MGEYKFPEGFKWGSATSAHQIEGSNHNDWTEWETSPARIDELKKEGKDPNGFISGRACDSYNRYEEDFDIAKKLKQNIHRFSIEWSRIEPEEGKFDFEAMKHYQGLVKSLRERGIEPMVTLWHFTNPVWFVEKGGFLNNKAPEYFTRYAKYVVDNLKDDVHLWITFNEADSVYPGWTYLLGLWPPQYKLKIFKYQRFIKNVIKSHILAYQELKSAYDVSPGSAEASSTTMSHNMSIGITVNNAYSISGNNLYERIIRRVYNYYRNLYFIKKTFPYYDFVGLNYYHLDRRAPGSYDVLPKQDIMPGMSWEIYPEGIFHVLKGLKDFNKPIFITENGIDDSSDQKRGKYIKDHLYWIWRAIQDGIDVRGYTYWSLLDNFEWHKGFIPRFGLVEIDYKTLERRIRPSAFEYAKICETNNLIYDK